MILFSLRSCLDNLTYYIFPLKLQKEENIKYKM